jgi:hypothetical protein
MAELKTLTRYIAYLDILGFRDMLREDDFEQKISEIIEVLEERRGFDEENHPYLKYLAVSDTIIITARKGHAPDLLWKITQVQNELLKLGFSLRGGIAYGELLIYDNGPIQNIFGPTFVSAYTIESERAIYPRVVIEDAAVDTIRAEFQARSKETTDIFILRDADGQFFVNQFARDVIGARKSTSTPQRITKNKRIFAKKIDEGFELSDPKAKMKWHWLKGQHKSQFRNI